MDQLAVPMPERSPLRARSHLIVGEDSAHVIDRVPKNSRDIEFQEVRTILGELKRAEDRTWIRSHIALEQNFDRGRNERCRCNCRRIGHGRSIGNSRGKGYRRRQCNGR